MKMNLIYYTYIYITYVFIAQISSEPQIRVATVTNWTSVFSVSDVKQ